jgi:N4-gp56 family major capsid protein
VTPDGRSLKANSIEAEVGQYGDYVTLSDMLDLTSIDNVVVEATKACGRQAGLTLDTLTREVLHSNTNAYYCPKSDGTAVTSITALDTTCTLTVKMVEKAAAILKANNAPKFGDSYVAIIHPYVAFDLMQDDRWRHPHEYKDTTNLFEGEIGKIGGVRFVESSEAKVYTGGVFGCLMLGANAYGVTEITGGGLQTIIKQKGSAGTADPLDQRSSIGWKAIKTAEILVQPYMYRIECKSKLSDKITEEN